jgi:hypothetical protein
MYRRVMFELALIAVVLWAFGVLCGVAWCYVIART